MVHVPSYETRQELLSVPHLVRFVEAQGDKGLDLTLIVKLSSMQIKYLIQDNKLEIMLFKSEHNILHYALIIHDDDRPTMIWSAVNDKKERIIFDRLVIERKVLIFIFNEACVNIAWIETTAQLGQPEVDKIATSRYEFAQPLTDTSKAHALLNHCFEHDRCSIVLHFVGKWHELRATYISNDLQPVNLNFLKDEEGSHQEALTKWLVDSLSPTGAFLNLRTKKGTKSPEFTDVTLSYQGGCILIESKTLAVLARKGIPTRDKLRRDTLKKVMQGASQLKGACNTLHSTELIYDTKLEKVVSLERTKPAHAICLVPDISLLVDCEDYGIQFVQEFSEDHGDIFQIMDTMQLFRVMQAAHMLANSTSSTMAEFDKLLLRRVEISLESGMLDFDMRLDMRQCPPIVVVTGHKPAKRTST